MISHHVIEGSVVATFATDNTSHSQACRCTDASTAFPRLLNDTAEPEDKKGTNVKNYRQRSTRREFLIFAGIGASIGLGAGAGILALSGQRIWPFGGGDMGARPSFPRAASTGRVRQYTFEAAPVNLTPGGKSISTWAYNGTLPGPEIRLVEGDTLRVTVKNRLPESTTIHWHGVPLINPMDGVPDVTQPAVKPGQDFTYDFLVPAAGTYMYHSHAGLQLDRGLYGALIVDSTKESINYDHDFAVVLDDWLDGMPGTPEDAMKQLIAGGDRMGGMGGMGGMGNGNMMSMQVPPDIVYPLYLINGKSSDDPFTMQIRQGQKARIRFINASASTIYRLALQGHRMTVTHTDHVSLSFHVTRNGCLC